MMICPRCPYCLIQVGEDRYEEDRGFVAFWFCTKCGFSGHSTSDSGDHVRENLVENEKLIEERDEYGR